MHSEVYKRWEPIPDLPELWIGETRFSYDGDRLTIEAEYANDPDGRVLELDFVAHAFKAYEEFSDPWMEKQPILPKLQHPANTSRTWPLLEVFDSMWISRVVERNRGIDGMKWRHFVISSYDKCLHVMALEPDRVQIR